MAHHDERLRSIRSAFADSNRALASQVEQLDDRTATLSSPGAWNASQIAWHVAATNEFLAGALSDSNASMLVPKPEGFQEVLATLQIPDKVKTFPMLEPPAGATRTESVRRLRASEDTFAKTLETMTPERCGAQCVKLPFGVLSLYELGEFAAAHILRHCGQVQRTVAAV